jgi:hypothetical protein
MQNRPRLGAAQCRGARHREPLDVAARGSAELGRAARTIDVIAAHQAGLP